MRRQDDPQYSDDPEFQRLSQELMTKLFSLTGNISRLTNEIALLGTKRDTERVRERVHDLLEESKDTFKDIGEGVKKIQSWEDVSVRLLFPLLGTSTNNLSAIPKIHPAKARSRIPKQPLRIPKRTATSPREATDICISSPNRTRRAAVTKRRRKQSIWAAAITRAAATSFAGRSGFPGLFDRRTGSRDPKYRAGCYGVE
jgi:hypothetical protein